ncbi:helix-turn-helix domain-containing protein [Paenibacillus sp. S150]|uniref:helix-turn-helix domain-containing protein n=1 Tax=Paenibacillus sp. S150 TaxID=2749826 RepID=UPI001C55B018|nr:helix-turn-helix domain-containing protein [Paenibacillus sp. S150]MBW4082554.1 helix-turn-helix domain-containing protein [Paenibacillus sp. S150]
MFNTLLVGDREIFTCEAERTGAWGEATGFRVADTANNGYEALRKLREQKYDLVITDIRMPIVDGIELLQYIKMENLCPCVVVLSDTDNILRNTLERAGKLMDCAVMNSGGSSAEGIEYACLEVERYVIAGCTTCEIEAALDSFRQAAADLYIIVEQDIPKLVKALNRLYFNLLAKVTKSNEWLHSFVKLSSYYQQCYAGNSPDELTQYYTEKLESLLLLLRRFKPAAGKGIIPEVCEYVVRHVDSQLSLKSVADSQYINHTYLSNKFKQETGLHFIDYITFVKMERARYLMETTSSKSNEISTIIGYSDPEYFSRLFKKHTKSSPAEYKKLLSAKKII